MPNARPTDELWSLPKAAEWLGVDVERLEDWARHSKVPHVRVMRGLMMFEPHELYLWVQAVGTRVEYRGKAKARLAG